MRPWPKLPSYGELFGLNLLLLLERGLTFFNILITISQPQPCLRHV